MFITGEKIQEHTDHSVVLNSQDNGANEIVKIQLKNIKCNYTYFEPNETIQNIPDGLLNAKSIFVYPHILDFFFEHVYSHLKHNFVLVTHNSDVGALQKYEKYLNEDKIVKWYASNIQFENQKLVALPLGIANSQWSHGNINNLDSIRNENIKKSKLVYKNFNINTNKNRYNISKILSNNGIHMQPPTDNMSYLREIANSYFCICPPGNGLDCHRTWECLYLGCVPIVQSHVHNNAFKDLPIIVVDDWGEINTQFLENKISGLYNYKKHNSEMLNLTYWKDRINEDINLCTV